MSQPPRLQWGLFDVDRLRMTSVAHGVHRTGDRWESRPVLADLLRGALLAVPLVASVVVVYTVGALIPLAQQRSWWALTLVLVSAVVTAVVSERIIQRLLPLTVLLQLTMLFPDRAPSRLKLARAAVVGPPTELFWSGAGATPTTTSDTVLALISALGAHDRKTRGHSERVRVLCDVLAGELKLDRAARDRLRWAALLHDVGKIAVAPGVLNKPAALDRREFDAVKEHPVMGASISAPLLPWLGEWGRGILEHHERYDGSGYPSGLAGQEISAAGRIIALVDSFETMTAARAYKKPMATKAAREELARCAGAQFDPVYVRAFLSISLPRMMWALGPVSFLVHAPFLRSLAEAGARSSAATGQAAASAAGVAVIATAGVGSMATATAEAPPPPTAAQPPAAAPLLPSEELALRAPQPPPAVSRLSSPTDLTRPGDTRSTTVAGQRGSARDGQATAAGAAPAGEQPRGFAPDELSPDDRRAGDEAAQDEAPRGPRSTKEPATRPGRGAPGRPQGPRNDPKPTGKPAVLPTPTARPVVPPAKPPALPVPVPVEVPTVPPLGPAERRVALVEAPAPVTTESEATFRMATARGLLLQCRDTTRGGSLPEPESGWQDCGATTTFSGLEPGHYTFQARSVDGEGRKGAVSTHSWRVVEDVRRGGLDEVADVVDPVLAVKAWLRLRSLLP